MEKERLKKKDKKRANIESSHQSANVVDIHIYIQITSTVK